MNIREYAMGLLLFPAVIALILTLAPVDVGLKLVVMAGVIGCEAGFTLLVAIHKSKRRHVFNRRRYRATNQKEKV